MQYFVDVLLQRDVVMLLIGMWIGPLVTWPINRALDAVLSPLLHDAVACWRGGGSKLATTTADSAARDGAAPDGQPPGLVSRIAGGVISVIAIGLVVILVGPIASTLALLLLTILLAVAALVVRLALWVAWFAWKVLMDPEFTRMPEVDGPAALPDKVRGEINR